MIRTKADELAEKEGCYFDPTAPEKVCSFIERCCTLSSGKLAYKPFSLTQFQRDFIGQLYGWRKPDGRRRFTRCLLTSGKKNYGKSVLASALALYHLLLDGVDSPFVVLGACTREQSAELYKEVLFCVRQNEKLSACLDAVESQKMLRYPKRNGTLKAITYDPGASSKGGWNCSFCVLDECALHRDANLYEMLKPSMRAREEPLLLMLSNAGFDKGHWYYKIYQKAKAILAGDDTDTSFLPVVYEVPEEANWKDRSKWGLANPGLGTVISEDSLEDDFRDAEKDKSAEMHFRRFSLNQWTSKKDAWLDLADFDRCKGALPPLADLPVWIGCDLSATTDWSSIAALYKQGETFYCKWYNFVPRSAIDKREKMNLKDWHTFAFDKSLTILDGNCIEQDLILETIQRIPGKVQSIVFDQWGALAIQQALIKKGYTVFRHPQSAPYFHEPCKRFEELVGKRQFIHEGGEANRYAINNCYLQQDSKGLCKPAKSSDYVKIDPAIAMLMALWQGVLGTETKTSIYEKHGIEHI